MNYTTMLASEFSLGVEQTEKTIALLDDGNTIPFIARYRKEVTGGIDDQVLRKLSDKLTSLRAIEERRLDVLRLIEEMGLLTPDIRKQIESASTMTALDDVYRPFRPKRKTRASSAKEKGLEPLADALMNGSTDRSGLARIAEASVSPEKGVADMNEAFAGASDIIAERLSDQPELRGRLRGLLKNTGRIIAKARKKEPSVYEQYYDYQEPVSRAAGHRVLAINRAEKEEFLSVSLAMDDELALTHIRGVMPQNNPVTADYLTKAAEDAWKRLILPSISAELRAEMTERAQDEAMRIFSQNLKNLLMIPPMRGHTVLALDPAYRTGCKLAVIDPTGKPLYTGVIFPTPPQNRIKESADEIERLYKQFKVTLIAFGNGTASRETERFIAETIAEKRLQVKTYMVNEAGASVYSASELAAAEFPELDLTKRSAISIGRRLQDPLAELVKIDPKAIGVGQYQHDMNPKKLEHTLGGVVESCVNEVGADVNTASASLLSYIAGINKPIAQNIVDYRETNGAFHTRTELLKVQRLGPKVYKQCAGFLRVPDGKDPLDNTRIHPESYSVARAVAASPKPLAPETLAEKLSVGLPTLLDIISALEDPLFDPRSELAQPELLADVLEIADLREGMMLTGVVRNVSAFGAFVDIGVHQDGLVHVSEMADRFVTDPFSVVQVGQTVRVRVIAADTVRKRISLSMKGLDHK